MNSPGTRERKGQVIGPYRLLEALEETPTQQCWLAQEEREGLSRRVELQLALAHGEGLLRQAAKVLAGLEHPGIPRLYAAGTLSDGTTYLARERVEGTPLKAFVDARLAGSRARIEFFLLVLATVGYAHHHLVTHRRLTPDSVRVTTSGELKVLGFGVAPEEVPGSGSLGVASDLQALGELLADLLGPLTGSDGEDVAAILARARGRDPAGSYPSAEALADDLRRLLAGYPVAARRGGRWYRARMFVGRHRRAVAATTLVAVSLAGGLAGALHQNRQARVAQQLAERRFADVQGLAHALIFDISGLVWELPRSEHAAELILDRALTYLQRLEAETGNDPALWADLAGGYGRLGDIAGTSRGFGKGTRRPEQAFAAWERGIALRQKLWARETSSPVAGLFLANDLQMYGDALRMNGQANSPRRAEVAELERQTLAELLARFPAHPRVRWAWAQHLATEAFLGLHREPPEGRRQQLADAWAAWQPFLEAPLEELRDLPQFGPAGSNLAVSLYDGGRYEEAAQTVQRAIHVLEQEGASYENHLSTAYGVLAVSLYELDRYQEALRVVTKRLALERGLYASSSDQTLSQINYFQALLNACLLAATAGDETTTLEVLREGEELLARLEGTWSNEALLASRLEWLRASGDAYSELAGGLDPGARTRYRKRARACYQEALELIAGKSGPQHSDFADLAQDVRSSLAALD